MPEEVFEDVSSRMGASIEHLSRQLGAIRTGRASLALLEPIQVDYYGTPTPLNQIATLAVPESRLITIQPWDPASIGDIEKAILRSDLGLTPVNDGKLIRVSIPPLTEERRLELVKVVKQKAEEKRIAIRNIRREGNERLKAKEKDKSVSEDDYHKGLARTQKITDENIKRVDEMAEQKEKEVMEV
ncbi:ribosome recycling factor [Nitrospinae bacterium AH-259-F20]|nr:ribosome recycling factor [Nitrospinae bacterium AH-259-F20]